LRSTLEQIFGQGVCKSFEFLQHLSFRSFEHVTTLCLNIDSTLVVDEDTEYEQSLIRMISAMHALKDLTVGFAAHLGYRPTLHPVLGTWLLRCLWNTRLERLALTNCTLDERGDFLPRLLTNLPHRASLNYVTLQRATSQWREGKWAVVLDAPCNSVEPGTMIETMELRLDMGMQNIKTWPSEESRIGRVYSAGELKKLLRAM
jgi:hypothetical protein